MYVCMYQYGEGTQGQRRGEPETLVRTDKNTQVLEHTRETLSRAVVTVPDNSHLTTLGA